MGLRAHVAEFRTTPIPFQRFAVVPEIELIGAADIRERHQVTLIGRFEQIGQAFVAPLGPQQGAAQLKLQTR